MATSTFWIQRESLLLQKSLVRTIGKIDGTGLRERAAGFAFGVMDLKKKKCVCVCVFVSTGFDFLHWSLGFCFLFFWCSIVFCFSLVSGLRLSRHRLCSPGGFGGCLSSFAVVLCFLPGCLALTSSGPYKPKGLVLVGSLKPGTKNMKAVN